MAWGANENPIMLRSNFELRVLEKGLARESTQQTSTPSQSTSFSSSRQDSPGLHPAPSFDSFDSVSEVREMKENTQIIEVKKVSRRRKLVSRASARIRRMARNTGEIGLKIVALPTFVLLDMLS